MAENFDHRVATQARLDLRQMAALAQYFDARGVKPRSRSQLVHLAVSTFHDVLVEMEMLEPIPSSDHALSVLEGYGIDWRDDKRGRKEIVNNLSRTEGLAVAFKRGDPDFKKLVMETVRERLGDPSLAPVAESEPPKEEGA